MSIITKSYKIKDTTYGTGDTHVEFYAAPWTGFSKLTSMRVGRSTTKSQGRFVLLMLFQMDIPVGSVIHAAKLGLTSSKQATTNQLTVRLGLLAPDGVWDQSPWFSKTGEQNATGHNVFKLSATPLETINPVPATGLQELKPSLGIRCPGQNFVNTSGFDLELATASFDLRRFDSQPSAKVWYELWSIDATTLEHDSLLAVSDLRDFDDIVFGAGAAPFSGFFSGDNRVVIPNNGAAMIRLNGDWTGDSMLRVTYKDNATEGAPNPGVGPGAPGRYASFTADTGVGSQGWYPSAYASTADIPMPTGPVLPNIDHPEFLYGSFTNSVDAPDPAVLDTLYEWGDASLSPDFTVNLGEVIQRWVLADFYDENYPIALMMDPDTSDAQTFMEFYTSDNGSDDPTLTVSYTPCGTKPHKKRRGRKCR